MIQLLKYEWVIKNRRGEYYNKHMRSFTWELTEGCYFTFYSADRLRYVLNDVFSVEQYRSSM